MTTTSAAPGGAFRLGGELPVHRLGYGAMRITGPGVWGEPSDRDGRSPSSAGPSSWV